MQLRKLRAPLEAIQYEATVTSSVICSTEVLDLRGGAKSWRKGGGKEAIRPLWGSEAKSSCYHVSVPNFWLTYGTGCIYMTDIARQIHQLQKVSDNILNILKLRQKRGRNALCLGSIPRNLVFIFTVCG